jgi:putative ABC transport system permease protein
MRNLAGDLRYVLRGWRRTPGFSITIVLTLAVSLALVSAIFAFADGYLFRPLPFPSGDHLYIVRDPDAKPALLRASDTDGLRQSNVAGFGFVEWSVSLIGQLQIGDRSVAISAYEVSPGFRAVVSLPLIAGRDFTADEHRETASTAAWLSHRFWTREFGSDRSVVGRTFRVRNAAGLSLDLHVVGILGPEVASFDLNNPPPDAVVPGAARLPAGPNHLSNPIVRLPPGMSREEGEARIAGALQGIAPSALDRPRAVRLRPLREAQVAGGRPTARVLFAGALLVLLLATVNLVHLLLTRAAARSGEVAVRAALGASRWRIARLFLAESVMLGALGTAAGLVLGAWLAALIAARVPTFPTAGRSLALVPMMFDQRAAGFAVILGFTVAFVGGWWPAWRALRQSLAWTNRSGTGVAAAVPARVSRSILTSQLAVATIVLTGSVFIGLGIWRYLHQPLGFDYVDRFQVAVSSSSPRGVSSAELDAIVRAISALPGVRAVGPYEVTDRGGEIDVPGRLVDASAIDVSDVSPGHFEAWNLRLQAGRWFTVSEFQGHSPVAIVDEILARQLWPNADPIGQEIRVAGGALRHIIGVVEPRRSRLDLEPRAQIWIPVPQHQTDSMLVAWVPRASAAEARDRLAAAAREVVPGIDVRVAPVTLETLFRRDVGEARFQAPIVIAFGLLAFALSAIGVFGLVSYLVEQRTREFGIRLALGALPIDVWRTVIRESVIPALVGLGIGVAGARALETVVRASVFGWESSSVHTIVVVVVALLGATIFAATMPARRAMSVDPAVALRVE